jgi:DNA/RNA endonuclease G (NUC1)
MSTSVKSFDALKAVYDTLATENRSRGGKEMLEKIRAFINDATAAGAFIEDADQRRAAQDMLDYWFTLLLTKSEEEMDVISPRLSDYQRQPIPSKDGVESPADAGPEPELERSRQIIRLGALARQWRLSEAKGYLLKGAALEDAKKYSADDRDIADLVAASEREQRTTKNHWIIALACVASVFAVLAGIAFWQALTAMDERNRADAAAALAREEQRRAEDEKAEADAQRRAAEAAARASEEARQNAERLSALGKADTEALSRRLAELQKQQAVLDEAIAVIRKQLQSAQLRRSDLPPVIAKLIKPDEIINIFADPLVKLTGYNSGFLGVDIALPALSDPNRQSAYQGGRPLDYLNYSIVLNQARRLAFYSAVNLDRDALRVLPRIPFRTPSRFQADPDPRVPRDFQVLADWFAGAEIDIGHLASRSEISWGSTLPATPSIAAQIRDDAANVYPNITQQFDTFNRGIWAALERWILSKHNPGARRVVIFTGPVFANNDPDIGGGRVPRAFWKVAISAVPEYSQSKDSLGYVVDAFLISQFKAGTNQKIDQGQEFQPEAHRVSIAEIERLTGLRFDEIIRSTDLLRQPTVVETVGDALAKTVGLLNDADISKRKAATQELSSALQNDEMDRPEQRKVISALLEMAEGSSIETWSASGRVNLFDVLSQVPAAVWNDPQAIDLKAKARAAVVALESRDATGAIQIGQRLREHLVRLEGNISYGKKSTQIVYLQFAGLTRDEASEISGRLQVLGWNMPGEERVKESTNEVRFNPSVAADETAAELLAADLRAMGRTAVTATGNQLIPAGKLEIWLSE